MKSMPYRPGLRRCRKPCGDRLQKLRGNLWVCGRCGQAYRRNFEGKVAPAGVFSEEMMCES